MRKTIACLDPIAVSAAGMRPLALDFHWRRVRSPRQIDSFGVLSIPFERPPVGCAKLEAGAPQKKAEPSPRSALRVALVHRTQRGKVHCIVQPVVRLCHQESAQHESVAVAMACPDRCEYRRILKFVYPYGAQSLVENSKRRQKTARGDRYA